MNPARPSLPQIAAAALLVLALTWFALRTGPRAGYWQWDFGVINQASRAWLAGQNPYDENALRRAWRASPVEGWLEHIDHVESLLPPPTLALMSPTALLPRRAGMIAWHALQWTLLIATIAALCSVVQLRQTDARALALAAGVFLLGPVQSGVQAGQPVVPAVACIVFAIALDARDRTTAAGILLGVAMALKLQLAAPFLVYFVFVGRWRTGLAAACLFAAMTLIGIARLELAGVPWWTEWLANVRRSTGPGGPNDFAAGVSTDHLLNLHLPLYAITGSRGVAKAGAMLIFLAAAVVYAVRLRQAGGDTPRDTLRLVAPVAVLALLPVYHRYYDATLLVIPLAVVMVTASAARRLVVLALLFPFALPVGWATNLVNRGYVPPAMADSLLWQILIIPLHVWLLSGLAAVLIAAIPHRR